jgi:hypothetical protein
MGVSSLSGASCLDGRGMWRSGALVQPDERRLGRRRGCRREQHGRGQPRKCRPRPAHRKQRRQRGSLLERQQRARRKQRKRRKQRHCGEQRHYGKQRHRGRRRRQRGIEQHQARGLDGRGPLRRGLRRGSPGLAGFAFIINGIVRGVSSAILLDTGQCPMAERRRRADECRRDGSAHLVRDRRRRLVKPAPPTAASPLPGSTGGDSRRRSYGRRPP